MNITICTFVKEHSVRCPGKNLREINGKSLLRHTIDFAKEIKKTITEHNINICVYTQSEKIKQEAKDCIIVHEDVVGKNIIDQFRDINNCLHSDVYVLLPTNYYKRNIDNIVSWIKRFCYQWAYSACTVKKNDRFNYEINGNLFMITRRMLFLGYKDIISADHVFYLDCEPGVDIDTEKDFKKAKELFNEN